MEGESIGGYRMAGGSFKREVVRKLWVICDDSIVAKLRTVARGLLGYLGQECIYFEIENANVEFLT